MGDKEAIKHMKNKQEKDWNCECVKLASQKTDWQFGQKNTNHLLALHRRLTSEPKTEKWFSVKGCGKDSCK